MNYYMPYFNMYPNMIPNVAPAASRGLFSRLFGGGMNWGSILNTAQKTLGLVNQAIPVIKQVTPVMKNAKTIFKVMNEFKRADTPNTTESINQEPKATNITNETLETNNIKFDGAPTFFIN